MTGAVLVLNANYEPINVCDVRRALGLILTDKATLVINGRGDIHTANDVFPYPSVIRLQRMIKRPRRQVKLNRKEIFRRDNYTCQYCGKRTTNLTIDHVVPRRLGGPYSWTNVVAACPACNHHKGGHRLQDVNMMLLHKPQEPSSSASYVYGKHLVLYSEWKPWLEGW